MLTTISLVLAFPLALLVPWAAARTCRQSHLCTIYVELVRGVPLISVLFMASFMFPLFMPQGSTIDVLIRALAGITLFAAAYMAGSFAVACRHMPKGQTEAAASLGPVVLADAVQDHPAAGARDGGARHHEQLHFAVQGHLARLHRRCMVDRVAGPGAQFRRRLAALQTRGYLFIVAIYFAFCFAAMSRYSLWIEAGQQIKTALTGDDQHDNPHKTTSSSSTRSTSGMAATSTCCVTSTCG